MPASRKDRNEVMAAARGRSISATLRGDGRFAGTLEWSLSFWTEYVCVKFSGSHARLKRDRRTVRLYAPTTSISSMRMLLRVLALHQTICKNPSECRACLASPAMEPSGCFSLIPQRRCIYTYALVRETSRSTTGIGAKQNGHPR